MSSINKEKWQFQWEFSLNGRHLWQIQSDVKNTRNTQGLNRKEEVIIHQMRLGKCKLNNYQHIINKHEDGLCTYCKISETIEHFLLHCKKYERERRIMRRQMKNDSLNLEKLLGNSSDLRIILNYIKSTKRFDIT